MASEIPVTLLGTQFEGGGGLIRDGLSYSTLLNRLLKITSIRANRSGVGGLRSEHTIAINTMAYLTGASVEGNQTASRELLFKPHKNKYAERVKDVDITVEGSAAIFMIAMLPYILFSHLGAAADIDPKIPQDGVEITIRAGTLCIKAPSFHGIQNVLLPTLKTIGIGEENLRLSQDHDQGWHTDFVKVPGSMKIWVKPLEAPLKPFVLRNRGRLSRIKIVAHALEGQSTRFGEVVKQEVQQALRESGNINPSYITIELQTFITTMPDQYHLLLVGITEDPEAFIGYEQVYPQVTGFPKGLADEKEELYTHLARVC
ncbi:RNA 3'-terminal phosphate cyclase/enolpyruvate transferase [Lophiotrema nucula]|uniref:RNA 3'-terminal phosphate cyclase/enolpyruvate transferase n=1 Tax=Lophiotrema nucula TaxID=690887 RepID=A0A6A5YXK9_9PLEO|nr:RNA 3'-terminal phosphate cyclase/enolpyruvate transferase [Lophiotrema nucula]